LKRQQQVEKPFTGLPGLPGRAGRARRAYICSEGRILCLIQLPRSRFAAQVQLRLPHAALAPARPKGELPAHWALGVPLALIIAWTALQAALWVISATLSVDISPVSGLRSLTAGFQLENC